MPLQTVVSILLLALALFLLSALLVWGLASIVRRIPQPPPLPSIDTALPTGGLEAVQTAPTITPQVEPSTQTLPSRRALSVLSPRNGVIRKLSVAMGERVEFGQELCVLETNGQMTAIRAGHTGVIASILIAESDPVKSGETIMEYAASGG